MYAHYRHFQMQRDHAGIEQPHGKRTLIKNMVVGFYRVYDCGRREKSNTGVIDK